MANICQDNALQAYNVGEILRIIVFFMEENPAFIKQILRILGSSSNASSLQREPEFLFTYTFFYYIKAAVF